jgi:hypothetical protein
MLTESFDHRSVHTTCDIDAAHAFLGHTYFRYRPVPTGRTANAQVHPQFQVAGKTAGPIRLYRLAVVDDVDRSV